MSQGKVSREVLEAPKPHLGHEWWHEPVYRSLEHLRQGLPHQQTRALVLHSGCSGVLAEKVVLDSFGAQVGVCIGADLKGASQRFVMDNIPGLTHFYSTIDELIDGGGSCLVHKSTCSHISGQRPDFAVFGPPCQPFSTQRTKTGNSSKTGSSGRHPSFHVTMKKVPDYVRKYRPHICIVEQVQTFMHVMEDGIAPAEVFIQDFGKAFEAVRAVELDASVWLDMQRPRPA